ncbi:amyloid beta A4 protein, partial [Biomphalaria glabrata]
DVFKAVGVKNYKVQNCSQNKESSIECLYDIANGQPQQCNCSFQNGTSGFFYGPADCRAVAPATHTNIVLYILTDWPDDIDKRMEIYNRLSEFFFTLESLYVGPVAYNGRPGCVAATVPVMLNNPGNLNFTIQKIKNTGILLNNKIVQITNENCDFTADLNLLNFKLPLVNFTWSDSLKNHSSEMYTAVLMAVQSTFSNLTGKPRYLEVVQKSDCAVIDVQWETTNISNFFTLMDKLKTNGLVISNKTYGVNKQQCNVTDDSVIVDFKFFVIQLPWLDSYTDINSDDFKQFRNALITNSSLKDLDGSPESLILMKRDSCVEVYVQWRNASKLFSVMDNLRKTGLDLDGVHYNISMKPCTLEPVMLLTYKKVKLYSNTLKWSDTLKNESSAEYLALQKDFLNQFNVNLDSFKLDVSFGCIELDIDFNINSNDLSKVDSMYSDGVTLNGSKFTTQFCSSVVYYSKFMWNITFEYLYTNVGMLDRTSIELQLNLGMRQYNIPGYNISRIVGFAPATSDQARVKRQTSGTVCMIESLFTSEVPVSRLYEVRQELLKKKTLSEMTILNITFGYGGGCPTENCFNMSFCVSTADGFKKCACPDMYFGKTCSDKNTSVICSNETVCKSDEKCYRTITCLGDNCKDKKTVCIAKNKNLACDNQTCASGSCDPCNGRGVCYNRMADRGNDLFSAGRVSYYCECNSGFGGDSCEVNQTICQKFQDVCKPTACLGDLENGQICQCPDLYGGLFCNKLARTPCEKWKAFYEDVQSIQSGNPALNITNEQKSILMSFKVSLNHTVCSMDVCNGVLCQAGEKCVAENATCSTGMCNLGVCKATMKPGVCPRPDISSFNKLLSNGLAACSPGDCFDDSDCDGEEKCCGLCGSKCMKPAATSACADDLAAASDLKELVSRSKMAIRNVKQDSDAYKVLMRLANISSLWIPKCKNKELYEALQCLESTSNQTEPKTCFCVDVWGKKIAGISPNTSDPNSCTVKPFTCPVLEPPSPSVRMFDCTSDLDCFGSNKCCSYGVGKMCTTPVDESQLITVLDKVMNRACTVSANLCLGNGTCNGDWKAKGEICVCPQGRIGPFCENTTTGPALTSCQKKALAYTVLRGGRLVSMSNMSNAIVLQQVLPSYNNSTEPFTVTDYNCLPNGDYSPTQCVHYLSFPSMSYVNDTECFCVDQNGQEILGTRISATLGQPFCGKNSMCPIGNPLSDDSGNPQTCNSSLKTPEGYVCKRSRYGRMFYCPTAEALDSICNLTLDVGSSNSEACSSTNSTRYYYNATTKTCQTFTFKGCAGNPNNFLTVDNCAAQCIKNPNMRPGSCPSDKVSVARGQCKDQCSSDVDCGLAQKCCKINCARQCVPAVDESNKNLKCPLGQSRGQCSASTPCGKGLYCNNGFCCLKYNGEEDSDFCSVPPVLGENCAAPEERYFYNSTSQMCQKFNYSGCQPEFNNFASLDDCCTSCGKKGRCKVGECPAIKIGSISSCGNQCSADGECPGKKICCSTGCGFQCVLPAVSSNTSDCVARQTQVKIKRNLNVTDKDPRGCDVTHIPKCESDGSWSKLQCQPTLGICWCVTSQGNYVENTITKGSPPCNTISVPVLDASDIAKKDVSSANITVCQTGTSPKCCPAALCHKPCAAYPNAQCVIDPCGGCTVKYYDETGLVDCTEKFTTCEKERNDVISYVLENHITSMLAMNMNLDDLEDEMNTTSTSSMTTGIALVT